MKIKRRDSRWKIFKDGKILLAVIFFCAVGFLVYYLVSDKSLFISPLPIGSRNESHFYNNTEKEITNLLQKMNIEYEEINLVEGAAYVIRLKNGNEVIFSSAKDIQSQVASLQLILSRLTIEGKEFSRLDFRYSKPVVVFK